jgi:hypothetical protein
VEDEITNTEGAFLDVAIMVASDTLKVPCSLDEGGAASFFKSIDINSSAIFRYALVVLLYFWRIPHDVGRENCFGAVDQEVWRLSRWLGGLST